MGRSLSLTVLLALLVVSNLASANLLCARYFSRDVRSVADFKAVADFALENHAYHAKMNHRVLSHFVYELPQYMDSHKILFTEGDIFRFEGSDAKMVKRILQDLDQNKIKRMEVLFARYQMRVKELAQQLLDSDVHRQEILERANSDQELVIPGWGKTAGESLENAKVFLAMQVRSRLEYGQDIQEAYILSQRTLKRYLSQWNPTKGESKLFEIMSKSFVAGLDPFSHFQTREELIEDATAPMRRYLSGFGLTDAVKGLFITSVHTGSAAEQAGLLVGDVIVAVQGTRLEGFDMKQSLQVLHKIQSPLLQARILRNNQEFDVKIMRGEIRKTLVVHSTSSVTRNGQVVAIRLDNFSEGASRIFLEGLNAAFKKGPVAGVVLDLRGNPGGYVFEAMQVLRMFLDKQPVFQYQAKGEVSTSAFKDKHATLDVPLVVMVDEGSASAAELVSGVLKAEKRAIILGARTWGKGTAHSVIENEFGGLKLTQEFFHFSNGESPQLRGVTPDIRLLRAESNEERAIDLKHALPEQKIASLDRSAYADPNRERIFDRIKDILKKKSLKRQAQQPPVDEKAELLEAFRILVDWNEILESVALPKAS